MFTQSQEFNRLSLSLLASGTLMFLLGGSAVIWPEDTLVGAMFITAGLAAAFGVYEIRIGLRARPLPEWRLPLVHGAALVGFALLTFACFQLPFRAGMLLIALWLTLYCMLMGGLALALWPMRRTRWALLAWTTANLIVAAVAVAYSGATIFALLFFGAVYATMFGAFQIASGVWVRRIVLPHVAPTTPSGWLASRD